MRLEKTCKMKNFIKSAACILCILLDSKAPLNQHHTPENREQSSCSRT
jgi:hypothetical protein